jgi:taurine--2-oxoglutarate transaminase
MDPLTEVGNYLKNNGLFTFINHHIIFIVPPLCITEAQLDEGIAIIDNALKISDKYIEQ